MIYPNEYGGTKPDDFDPFYELIMWDELARSGGGGAMGQLAINSMALPPILLAGEEWMKEEVCRPVIRYMHSTVACKADGYSMGSSALAARGDINASLAISEPYAGSDVANIRTSAVKDGDHYLVRSFTLLVL